MDVLKLWDLPVLFVDDRDTLEAATQALLAGLEIPHEQEKNPDASAIEVAQANIGNLKVVGLDTEWRPERFRGENFTSILQVALVDQVFIFDLLRLCKSQLDQLLDSLLRTLLASRLAVKVGTDFVGDLLKLRQSYSNMRCFEVVEPYIELQAFHSSLHQRAMSPAVQSQIAASKGRERVGLHNLWQSQEGKKGLSWLVGQYLGKKLDKLQCMSDWAARPLNDEQISYAALDAHSQIALYEAMTKMLPEGDLPRGAQPFALTSQTTVELDTARFLDRSESEKDSDLDESPLPEEGTVVNISGIVFDIRFEGCSRAVPLNTLLQMDVNGRSIELETTKEQPADDVVRAVPGGGFLTSTTASELQLFEVGTVVRVLPRVRLPDYSTWEPASPPRVDSNVAWTAGRVNSAAAEFTNSELRQSNGNLLFEPALHFPQSSQSPQLRWPSPSQCREFPASPSTPTQQPLSPGFPSTPVPPPPRLVAPSLSPWQSKTPDRRWEPPTGLHFPASSPRPLPATGGRKRSPEDFVTPPRLQPPMSAPPLVKRASQPRQVARQLFFSDSRAVATAQEASVLAQKPGPFIEQFAGVPQYEDPGPQQTRYQQERPDCLQTPARPQYRFADHQESPPFAKRVAHHPFVTPEDQRHG